jgi:hypothetical protein
MKRLKCDKSGCVVYKAGRCFDVGKTVYKSIYTDVMKSSMPQYNIAFAKLAVALLKSGATAACSSKDAAIAKMGILGY